MATVIICQVIRAYSAKSTAVAVKALIGVIAAKLEGISVKQEEQHRATNSRLTELLVATEKSSHALGVIQGVKEEQERIVAQERRIVEAEMDRIDKQILDPNKRLQEIRGES